jgi:hypothetical protein
MKKIILFLLLLINSVCSGQLLNSSFENWTFNPDADLNSQKWILNDWLHCDKNGDQIPNPITNLFGTYKDSIAQSGSSALTLSRWYNYTYDIAKFKNKCDINPTSLNGFYKYPESILSIGIIDTAKISVYLTKFNSINQIIDTIGSGKFDLAAANNFTVFDCPILYSQQNLIPDSIIIVIQPSKFKFGVGGCPNNPWCSYLTVDDINLSVSTGTAQVISQSLFLIYPNPASSSITIAGEIYNKQMKIINILGEAVFVKIAASNYEIIDTRNLPRGIYYLTLNDKTEKFIIQ